MSDTERDYGCHLTRNGFALLAKALAGQELHFTRAALGDSMDGRDLIDPTREEQFEFNELINEREFLDPDKAPFISIQPTGGGTVALSFSIRNANVPEGFWKRELGLFARDPDTGDELLYCYQNTGLNSEYIPSSTADTVYDVVQTVITVIQEAANVTAVVDGGLAYVTQAEFRAHVDSQKPHLNAPTLGREVTTTDYFWAQEDADKNLHPISTDNARRLILGGDAADIPKLDRRLTQTEINIANLFMQLNAERELGLQPNLMLIEDFQDTTNCDMYSVATIAQAAGIAEIGLETDADILTGHWYTITDGVNNEYLRVRSVAKNGGKTIVIFEQTLTNTYNLDNTWLMRSTVLIVDGHAMGAGDLRGKVFTFPDVWRGTGADTSATQMLNTTNANIDAFELSGEYAFSANGAFTMKQVTAYIYNHSYIRSATGVTMNSCYGDFGRLTSELPAGTPYVEEKSTLPGNEYFGSLFSITASKENSTIIGSSRANTIRLAGGANNVLTGGLGNDQYIFNCGGGIITDFGAGATKDTSNKMYANTTTQQDGKFFAYNRTTPVNSYNEGVDKLHVNGTITRIAFSGHGDDSTSDNQTFNATVYYTASKDNNQYTIELQNIVKPVTKKLKYYTEDTALNVVELYDTRTGSMQELSDELKQSLATTL